MTVGEAMKKARQITGLSIKQLSEISGVLAQLIGRYERDIVKPRIDTVEMLADALEISIDEYIGHTGDPDIHSAKTKTVKECIEKIKSRSSSCVAMTAEGIVVAGSRTYTISEVELYKIVKEMVGAESG